MSNYYFCDFHLEFVKTCMQALYGFKEAWYTRGMGPWTRKLVDNSWAFLRTIGSTRYFCDRINKGKYLNAPLTSLGGNCGEGTGIGTGCFTTYAADETRLDWSIGSTSVMLFLLMLNKQY